MAQTPNGECATSLFWHTNSREKKNRGTGDSVTTAPVTQKQPPNREHHSATKQTHLDSHRLTRICTTNDFSVAPLAKDTQRAAIFPKERFVKDERSKRCRNRHRWAPMRGSWEIEMSTQVGNRQV